LVTNGYQKSSTLTGLVRAWHSYFDLLAPDVIIADAAPTALLAANTFPRRPPSIAVGCGWGNPPSVDPFPSLAFWVPLEVADCHSVQEPVRRVVSETLTRFGALPVSLSAALAPSATLVASLPELDHYAGQRDRAEYVGPLGALDSGVEPTWACPGGWPRVFAYLRGSSEHCARFLGATAGVEASILLVAPGASEADAKRWSGPTRIFCTDPVRLRDLRHRCDLAVCHGGTSTQGAFLLAGVPLLLLPDHYEQLVASRRCEEAGLGRVLRDGNSAVLAELLRSCLADVSLRQRARDFATRHASFERLDGAEAVAERVGRLLQEP
jgi:UDP:flavonoid glycosyltransferase YjiC (YdhE family)